MDVKLPQLGEGSDSGEVVGILVAVGDVVELDQTVIELENAKAVAPIPSPAAGTVTAILVEVGSSLSVGDVILKLDSKVATGGSAPGPAAKLPTQPTVKPEIIAPVPGKSGTSIPGLPPAASPTVRRYARDLGIDLNDVVATERGGRVGMGDLRNYIQGLIGQSRAAKGGTGVVAVPIIDSPGWGEVTRKPLSGIRKVIAERMTRSWTTIPHVTQFDEADITNLLALSKKHAAAYAEQKTKLTLTGFILRALVPCLQEHAILNASIDTVRGELVYKSALNVGIAVDSEHGLTVPVIRQVGEKSLLELSEALVTLAERARQRQTTADEMKDGTFTISNQGGIGGGHFTPIVNAPEAAILGVGRGKKRPGIVDGKIEPRVFLPLCLSYDHRLIDGGTAARFITQLVGQLENFSEDSVQL